MEATLGAIESDLGEAVLGDLNGRASVAGLLAQVLHLGDGQAGVVRDDDDAGLRKDLVQRRDGFLFLRSVHGCSLLLAGKPRRLRHAARAERETAP